jgi:hypothetical protein
MFDPRSYGPDDPSVIKVIDKAFEAATCERTAWSNACLARSPVLALRPYVSRPTI